MKYSLHLHITLAEINLGETATLSCSRYIRFYLSQSIDRISILIQ